MFIYTKDFIFTEINKKFVRKFKQRYYQLDQIEIQALSSEGKGIAKVEGKVIFVDEAVTGDIVDIKCKQSNKNYEFAEIIKIHKQSPLRQVPHCSHYELCGGCKTQHIQYKHQLEWKQQVLKDALDRIAQIDYPEIEPILGCEITEEYRNKLDYAASNKRWLTGEEIASMPEDADRSAIGFHKSGMFDKIIDITKCHHMPDFNNQIRNFIRIKALELQIPFYDIKEQNGNLRNILIRNTSLDEWMVCIIFREWNQATEALMKSIAEAFPNLNALLYAVNQKGNDTIYDLDIKTFYGAHFIMEQLKNKKFKVGAKSFFQTNSKQCEKLYDLIIEMSGIEKTDTVYDLYCGVGSIGIYVSEAAKKVVGIELVPEAIEDAKENVAINQIENCTFYASDMKNLLNEDFVEKHGRPDVIITDPPRAGMHPDVVDKLLEIEAPKLLYVSCNPQNMCKELKVLSQKYEIARIRPVDMFPHTLHLETVALLKLK
jgi:23S rRNA (uracil1939-C5)-methyltransferase